MIFLISQAPNNVFFYLLSPALFSTNHEVGKTVDTVI